MSFKMAVMDSQDIELKEKQNKTMAAVKIKWAGYREPKSGARPALPPTEVGALSYLWSLHKEFPDKSYSSG